MPATDLYSILVPNAPVHRRTERDVHPSPLWESRAKTERFLLRAPTPGLQEPSLISSFQGTIQSILFAFPSYAVRDPTLVPAYKSVIAALRAGTRFVVVHHQSHREPIEEWFSAPGHPRENVTYVPLPDYVSFTDWAEDGYVALKDASDGSGYLMEPWEFPRAGDALIAESVQEYVELKAAQAPLIFQGGNCLVGDEFWLIGKDYVVDSVALVHGERPPVDLPSELTPEAFVRRLFKDYVDARRRLLIIGTNREIPLQAYYGTRDSTGYYLDLAAGGAGTFQPIFHIDMFISLIGRNEADQFEVLVGSPRLGAEILGTPAPYALDDVYDSIAKFLTQEGMKVHRNPLVHQPTPGRTFTFGELRNLAAEDGRESLRPAVQQLQAAGAADSTTVRVRDWHHITWNNCLVENSSTTGKRVYLPTFGHGANERLRVIDERMKAIWEGLGFTVHLLGDFNEFARRQGVVHCIKKYLDRSI